MTYVYMALIAYGVFIFGILSVAGLLVWALPRYGAQALRMALAPKFPSPVVDVRCDYRGHDGDRCERTRGHDGPHEWPTFNRRITPGH
jgi:hypothetical protein